jgi:hypothetical protein
MASHPGGQKSSKSWLKGPKISYTSSVLKTVVEKYVDTTIERARSAGTESRESCNLPSLFSQKMYNSQNRSNTMRIQTPYTSHQSSPPFTYNSFNIKVIHTDHQQIYYANSFSGGSKNKREILRTV